jgi:predicted component of type VI protein secretion system
MIRYAAVLLLALAAFGCNSDSDSQSPGTPPADVTINIVAQNGANSFSPNPHH